MKHPKTLTLKSSTLKDIRSFSFSLFQHLQSEIFSGFFSKQSVQNAPEAKTQISDSILLSFLHLFFFFTLGLGFLGCSLHLYGLCYCFLFIFIGQMRNLILMGNLRLNIPLMLSPWRSDAPSQYSPFSPLFFFFPLQYRINPTHICF